MENVTISVLNEYWKSIVLSQQRGDGQEVQRTRNSPLYGTKRGCRVREPGGDRPR